MQKVMVHIGQSANGSAFVRVTRMGSSMVLIMPRFLILRAQGFSCIEQSKILINLAKDQEEFLEKASEDEFEFELSI